MSKFKINTVTNDDNLLLVFFVLKGFFVPLIRQLVFIELVALVQVFKLLQHKSEIQTASYILTFRINFLNLVEWIERLIPLIIDEEANGFLI